jgi:hypothetical protein
MPSVEWTNPHKRLEGEKLKADEMREQFTNNLTWLFQKNFDIVQASGVSDYQTTSTTPVVMGVMTCTLKKASDDTVIRVGFTASAYNSASTNFLFFDVLIDGAIYASSGTGTPDADGLVRYQQSGNAVPSQISLEAYIDNVSAGIHTFTMVWWTSAGTATINVTNTIVQMVTEEYGVTNVLLI